MVRKFCEKFVEIVKLTKSEHMIQPGENSKILENFPGKKFPNISAKYPARFSSFPKMAENAVLFATGNF